MNLLTPLILLAIVITTLSCQNDSSQGEDLALKAAKEYFRETNVTFEDSKQLYMHYCSICHGNEGKGDGFNSYNLDPKPKDFADSSFLAKADSTYIVNVIAGGGKAVELSAIMPPYSRTLTKKEIEKLASYIIFLSKGGSNNIMEEPPR